MSYGWLKSTGIWTGRVLLSVIILFALGMGFGTPSTDAERMRLFADSVERWQHNPEFRKVQIEYVEQGSDAMRTKTCFCGTTTSIMWLRSLPGLPPHLKVNDTSFNHYTNFTRGALSAYMHLTGEQGLTETLKMLQYLGNKQDLNDDDIRDFLKGYKLHYPVCSDTGAVESVRRLINDVDAGRAFAVSDNVAERIKPHIAATAASMGYRSDIAEMTPEVQMEVWQVLDDEIRNSDYELWRTKQVNDWLNGVWAQVYGTMYSGLIKPTLLLREVGRVAGPMLLMAWVGLGLWKRKKAGEVTGQAAVVPPRLALEGGKDLPEV